MKFKLEKIYYAMALFLSLAVSIQLEYVFFTIYNFFPFVSFLLVFLVLVVILICKIDKLRKSEIFYFILFTALFFLYLLSWANYINANFLSRTLVFLFYILISNFILNYLISRIDFNHRLSSFKFGLFASTFILSIEFIVRFFFPHFLAGGFSRTAPLHEGAGDIQLGGDFIESKAFYIYKYSSIMFYDTNYVGLFALTILICLFFYIFNFKSNFSIIIILILNAFFVVASFSRSAILVMILVLFFYFGFYFYVRKKYIGLFSYLAVLFLSLIFILFKLFDYILNDGSFETKIGIFLSIGKFFNYPISDILFGFGLLDGGSIISYQQGKYAHAFIAILLGQMGLLGLLIYLISFVVVCLKSGFHGFVLFISFFITGLSLVDPWQVIYFWSAIYMCYLYNSKKTKVSY